MKLLIVSQFILYLISNSDLTLASTGSPEWDRLLAETSQIEPIRKSDDLHSYLDSFPPIPAFEHAIDPSTLSTTKQSVKKTKRILRQDPKNVARRLKYAESVQGLTKEQKPWQTKKYKESKEFRTGRRKSLRANLKLPGNEEKLRKSQADRAVYNKTYRTKIAQEIANGTISKERKEIIEKAKQRKRLRNIARNRSKKDNKM